MNPAPADARLPLRPPPRVGSGPVAARPPLHDLDEAERIASKDRSSLYRVSQFFEDPLRYHAFIAMYAVMRVIDDRIDGAGGKSRLPLADGQALHAFLDDWEHRIRCAYA